MSGIHLINPLRRHRIQLKLLHGISDHLFHAQDILDMTTLTRQVTHQFQKTTTTMHFTAMMRNAALELEKEVSRNAKNMNIGSIFFFSCKKENHFIFIITFGVMQFFCDFFL
jgi:hypothetical protein